MREQLTSSACQGDAARASLEERIANQILETLHLHADGRLGSAKRVSGAGKILEIRHRDEAAQQITFELDRHTKALMIMMFIIIDIR
jgi:hypothetical protein